MLLVGGTAARSEIGTEDGIGEDADQSGVQSFDRIVRYEKDACFGDRCGGF